MAGKRRSLGVKIAVANSLLAVFLVSAVVALVHRKDRRLLEANIRRELTQMVAVAALLLEGSGGKLWEAAPKRAKSLVASFGHCRTAILLLTPCTENFSRCKDWGRSSVWQE